MHQALEPRITALQDTHIKLTAELTAGIWDCMHLTLRLLYTIVVRLRLIGLGLFNAAHGSLQAADEDKTQLQEERSALQTELQGTAASLDKASSERVRSAQLLIWDMQQFCPRTQVILTPMI